MGLENVEDNEEIREIIEQGIDRGSIKEVEKLSLEDRVKVLETNYEILENRIRRLRKVLKNK